MKLTRLKRILIEKCATLDQSQMAFQWTLLINGVVVSDMDGANRIIESNSRVELNYKKQQQMRKRKETPREEEVVRVLKSTKSSQVKYDMTRKLLQIIKEPLLTTYSSEEGMAASNVFDMFGFINAHLDKLVPSGTKVSIKTRPSDSVDCSADIVLEPVFIPGHVSLLCRYQGRSVAIDSSRSLVNYQAFDDSLSIRGVELAGGNCGIFTVVMAIRCLLYHDRYSTIVTGFNAFWNKLVQVIQKTEADTTRVLLAMASRIYKNPLPVPAVDGIVPMLLRILPDLLRPIENVDYLADVMFLDLFLETNIGGLDRVTLLGNVLRTYMRDIRVDGGFVGGRAGEAARPRGVLIAALILTGELPKPTEDDVEDMELYLGDKGYDEMEENTVKIARIVMSLYYGGDTKTSPQMLARTFLGQEKVPASPPVAPAPPPPPLVPVPESARELVGTLFAFARATLGETLVQRLIRVPYDYWMRTMDQDQVRVVIRNLKTNQSTMAFIEGNSESGEGVEFSPLIANYLTLEGPFEIRAYYQVPAAQFIRFSGDATIPREVIEARLNFAPGIVAGEVILPGLKVEQVIVNDTPVRFAAIQDGEIKYEMCANCGGSVVIGACAGCRRVSYCGAECQGVHWVQGGHGEECF